VLTKDGQVIAKNRLVLPLFKELSWAPAKPEVTVKDGVATFTSQSWAWGVCLDLDGGDGLADNFFDVFPGLPHRIPWTGTEKPRILRVGNLVGQAAAKA
jgi:beta-mannosidase